MANRFVLNETSYHGYGAVSAVADEIKARGFKKAFVCSDPDLIKFGVTKKVTDVLDATSIPYEIYSDIKANPSVENVQKGVAAFKAAGTDCIVAIGGGSSIDTAKAIGIIITIPDKFINTDTSVKRVYRMIRIHDGKATVIDGTFDANTKQFTFATDGFSTYALVYEDVAATTTTPATTSPKTNDTSLPIAWLLLLGAGLCGCMAVTLVKKKTK